MTHILVIDDEPSFGRMVETWLKSQGHQATLAFTGADGFESATRLRPDLVLLDAVLPDTDGIDLCRRLRAGEGTQDIPIILVTAYDPTVGRVQALLAGASDYITKPLQMTQLVNRVQLLLGDELQLAQQTEQLLQDTARSAISVLSARVVWLLGFESLRSLLSSRVISAGRDELAASLFTRHIQSDRHGGELRLSEQQRLPVATLLKGEAMMNLTLDDVRRHGDQTLARACQDIDVYYVSVIPLQDAGSPVGVMLLGSRDAIDLDTHYGRQLLETVTGQVAAVLSNARLINQLAASEARNRQERAFRQMLLDTMADGLVAYSFSGAIRFANRRFAIMTGYSLEQVAEMHLEGFFSEKDRGYLREHLLGEPRPRTAHFEYTLTRADGSQFPVLVTQARAAAYPELASLADEIRVLVVTDVSELRRLDRRLADQTRRLRALNRSSQAINSIIERDDALQVIIDETRSVMEAEFALLLQHHADTNELVIQAASTGSPAAMIGQRLPLDDSFSGYAFREQHILISNDIQNDSRFNKKLDLALSLNTRSLAVVPLLVQGQVIGAISVANKADGFSELDVETLEGLGRAAAIALENVQLFDELQARIRDLSLLVETSEAASSTLSIERILARVGHKVLSALDMQHCIIGGWQRADGQLLRLAEIIDMPHQNRPGSAFPLTSSVRRTLLDEEYQVASLDHPDISPFLPERLLSQPLHTSLVMPIRNDQGLMGMALLLFTDNSAPISPIEFERCRVALDAWQPHLNSGAWPDAAILGQISARLRSTADAAWSLFFSYDPAQDALHCIYEQGELLFSPDEAPGSILHRQGLRHMAIAERTSLSVPIDHELLEASDLRSLPQSEQGTLILASIIARGDVLGLLQLFSTQPAKQVSEEKLALAQAVGSVLGHALANTRLYNTLLRRATELEAAYNDLREADRLKEEWVQNVSHELRTPLTSILGHLDLVSTGDLGPLTEAQMFSISSISEQGRKLYRLVEDLLAMQKMEEGHLQRSEVSLAIIADSAIKGLEESARRRDLRFERVYPEDLPLIYADPEWIFRLLDKLLGNAVKFSHRGGLIRVILANLATGQQITVQDEGIGIAPEHHERIWRRFYQVDGSMTRQYGGMGLGLAIARWAVEQHHGRIWVESDLGKGSSFHALIPKSSPSFLDSSQS